MPFANMATATTAANRPTYFANSRLRALDGGALAAGGSVGACATVIGPANPAWNGYESALISLASPFRSVPRQTAGGERVPSPGRTHGQAMWIKLARAVSTAPAHTTSQQWAAEVACTISASRSAHERG